MNGSTPLIGQSTQIVGSIYDAAINPENWPRALDPIAAEVGAKGCILYAIGAEDATPFAIDASTTNFPRELMAEYVRDFWTYEAEGWNLLKASPAGTCVTDEILWPDRDAFNNRPDTLWCVRRMGIRCRAAVKLNDEKAWFDALTFQYVVGRGGITGPERAVARSFEPHLAKAVEIGRGLNVLRARFQAALAALDRWHIGHVLVRSDAGIVYANISAKRIFDARDGVDHGYDGVLRLTAAHLDAEMKRAVADVAATAAEEGSAVGRFLKVPKRSHGGHYALEIAPVRDADGEIDRAFRGAWVTIVDPDRREHLNLTGMAALYGLTPAESEILTLLMDGLRTNEIADHRSVSLGATRQQIKSILAKTDCHDRTDLVRRVFTVNLPIDGPEADT
ncbi:MAG: helix-turn-helix transcriptional regulator [Alphaproteobacteria bacterium]|nr:helix-turn-helix transcriptional regulator [Alphaproteobacteria bacterium]